MQSMKTNEQTPGDPCNCGGGLPVLADKVYVFETTPDGVDHFATFCPRRCGECVDVDVASDLYKDQNGFRPRHMDRAELLAWLYAQS